MAHLKTLLATKEGRQYVALCLVDAFHKNEEIRPGLPRAPYPHMTLDDVAQTESEDLARRAHLVLHVNKSRDTDQGWVVIETCPNPHDFLAPTLEVDRKSMGQLLRDNEHLKKQVTELQTRGTELVMENRDLRNKANKYAQHTQDIGNDNRGLQEGFDARGKRIEELEAELQHFKDLAELNGRSLHECQMENIKLQEDNRNLETSLKDTRVDCHKCGGSYPIDERLYCDDCIQRYYQMQCESCGSNIPQKDGCYCEDCHGNESDLEERLAELERLLGQAVVEMNKKGPPDSEWMKKYKALHEKYLHQTPTGRVVDLKEGLEQLRQKNIELGNAKQKLEGQVMQFERDFAALHERMRAAEKENKSLLEMHDNWTEEIIDELEPHFYDRHTVTAQGGADYPQIISAIRGLVEQCAPKDFREQMEMLIQRGYRNYAIAQRLGLEDNDATNDLISLIRKLLETKSD